MARNGVSDEARRVLDEGGAFEDVRELVNGKRGAGVYATGDPEAGVWWAGQAQGLIHDVPTCAKLVERIIGEAEGQVHDLLAGMVGSRAAA